MLKHKYKLKNIDRDILDVLGIEHGEVFLLKDFFNSIKEKELYRLNYNLKLEVYRKAKGDWIESLVPNISSILDEDYTIIKCFPKVYDDEVDLLLDE